jgi:hypothetical protein
MSSGAVIGNKKAEHRSMPSSARNRPKSGSRSEYTPISEHISPRPPNLPSTSMSAVGSDPKLSTPMVVFINLTMGYTWCYKVTKYWSKPTPNQPAILLYKSKYKQPNQPTAEE